MLLCAMDASESVDATALRWTFGCVVRTVSAGRRAVLVTLIEGSTQFLTGGVREMECRAVSRLDRRRFLTPRFGHEGNLLGIARAPVANHEVRADDKPFLESERLLTPIGDLVGNTATRRRNARQRVDQAPAQSFQHLHRCVLPFPPIQRFSRHSRSWCRALCRSTQRLDALMPNSLHISSVVRPSTS